MRKLLRCDSEVSRAVSGDAIEYIYRGMIVRGWGYLDYLNSIRVDVAEGLEVLGYDVFQSLYFAYSSLELKLQHDSDEVVFALTAVLVVIMERGVLPEYKDTDEFVVGFMGCCAGGGVGAGAALLQGDDRDLFNGDVERVVAAFGGMGFVGSDE